MTYQILNKLKCVNEIYQENEFGKCKQKCKERRLL